MEDSTMTKRNFYWQFTFVACLFAYPALLQRAEHWDGKIVQFGKMHEAIGKKQHHGRVRLKELMKQKHFYAVAALERLEGEITILDGDTLVTSVGPERKLRTDVNERASEAQATMLVGAYVPQWNEVAVSRSIRPEEVEEFIVKAAADAGIDTTNPFPFVVEGELTDVRLHVINGACPMHARLNKIELPQEISPVELEHKKVRGTLVGIFAKDAVGNLTHPATSMHTHAIFGTKRSKRVTGHVERVGISAGSVLRLPFVESP
jgi:alpha-acetolactate decarboxylase